MGARTESRSLTRHLGLLGLAATGICSMMGAAINIIPIMLQRSVPGIGPHVLSAYALAAVPALLAALAYAILGSGMPRAGGSYVYASRSLNPYLGFVASFSQWFGLSIAIGVVSYVLVPFTRDLVAALGMDGVAATLEVGGVRVSLALAFLWTFAAVNLRGGSLYERTLIPMMFLMFACGSVVIVAGFLYGQDDFVAALAAAEGIEIVAVAAPPLTLGTLLAAAAVLFSSFIGFDSIAQAGGEARNPGRNMPLAVGIAIVGVGSFYIAFTASVYHVVPWSYIAERAQHSDLTAPGLLGFLLPEPWTIVILAGATIALLNDLPAMLLSVSRLVYAWAEDGVFPQAMAALNRFHMPSRAVLLSALTASAGIVGSHLAGDFFLGVDILVTSMLVNFLLMCLSVLVLPMRNPELAARLSFGSSPAVRWLVGLCGSGSLALFLVIHVARDMQADVAAWYFRSTWSWLLVMLAGSLVFWTRWRRLREQNIDLDRRFAELPATDEDHG